MVLKMIPTQNYYSRSVTCLWLQATSVHVFRSTLLIKSSVAFVGASLAVTMRLIWSSKMISYSDRRSNCQKKSPKPWKLWVAPPSYSHIKYRVSTMQQFYLSWNGLLLSWKRVEILEVQLIESKACLIIVCLTRLIEKLQHPLLIQIS